LINATNHPQLQELVSRLIVTVVPPQGGGIDAAEGTSQGHEADARNGLQSEPAHPEQFTEPPFQGA
jgi:hypothetical protein